MLKPGLVEDAWIQIDDVGLRSLRRNVVAPPLGSD